MTRWLLAAVLVAGTLAPLGTAGAQPEGWVKVKRQTPGMKAISEPGPPRMAGIEVGFPGVFAPRVLFPVADRHSVGVGPIMLPGLIGMVGEYRYYLTRPRKERFSFHTGSALALYDIRSGDRSATSLGLFLSAGTSFLTRSRFVLGGSVGFLATSGSEESDPVKSFGIRKGMSTATVNFSVSYAI